MLWLPVCFADDCVVALQLLCLIVVGFWAGFGYIVMICDVVRSPIRCLVAGDLLRCSFGLVFWLLAVFWRWVGFVCGWV